MGAGAAGMMAAIAAAKFNVKVTLIEKMEKAGRKIAITGKGRCNITNTKPWSEFSTHVHPNSRFLKHSFFNFSNIQTIEFFNKIGLETVTERGDRVFPKSGVASDVTRALLKEISRLKVEVLYNTKIEEIDLYNNRVSKVTLSRSGIKHFISPGAMIIASGGLSYPLTGSDGDGLRLSAVAGHTVTRCWPSLTALKPENYNKELDGIRLKNTSVALFIDGVLVQSEMGDMDFTSNGIEGSIGYKISRKAVKSMINGGKCSVEIDLKPAISAAQLRMRIERELEGINTLTVEQLLRKLMPANLISPFIASNRIIDKSLSAGMTDRIKLICSYLKSWKMNIVSFTSYERAVVTAGGVSLDEVISKNMRSKLIDNLYFAGEVLDIDCDTGGYNLQTAFSTGYLAGEEAAKSILQGTIDSQI